MTLKDLKILERTLKDLKGLGGTWMDLKGIGRTWKDLEGLGRTWKDLEGHEETWNEIKQVQDLEKCDRRQTDRQMKEGVTDKASTREACASKNYFILLQNFLKY